MAGREAADLSALLHMAGEMRPNPKSVGRLAARLKGRPGVTRVTRSRDGRALTLTARTVRAVEARVEGATAFHETGLIYLRACVGMEGHVLSARLCAASFCIHALERLVERSDLDLQTALLPRLDAEAQAIFRGWDRDARITDADDEYYPATIPGVWAGGHDAMAMDSDWNLCNPSGQVPVFSARTFLSETEMRPTLWLRWKDDPTCRVA